jgi:uncharacterized protein YbaR (Trm112 family)
LFIELTEILRCPRGHAESYLVAAPIAMDGRRIVRGVIGCPECHAEFPIVDGVGYFGAGETRRGSGGGPPGAPGRPPPPGPPPRPPPAPPPPPPGDDATGARPRAAPEYDAAALAAFLDLDGPGGYAVLVGRAARLGATIVEQVPGVHFVAVNPLPGVHEAPALSVLRSLRALPFKSASVRGVALGADHAAEPWLGDAVRILLPGLRLVVEDERASPEGVSELARGAGVLVGAKRPG